MPKMGMCRVLPGHSTPRIGVGNATDGATEQETAVQLLDKLFGPQSRNLNRAMDLTTQRAGLITRNLANVNVPNYKRQDIDFGIEPEGEDQSSISTLRTRRSRMDGDNESRPVRLDGNSVNLEDEVMSMAEMEVRYQLMTEITSRYFSGLKSVIREGR